MKRALIFLALFLVIPPAFLFTLDRVVVDAPPPQDADLRPAPGRADPASNAHPDFAAMAAQLQLTGAERGYLKAQLEAGATDWAVIDALTRKNAPVLELFARFSRRGVFEDPASRDPAAVTALTPVPQFYPLVSAAQLVALRSQRHLKEGRPREALADALLVCDAGEVLLRSAQPLLVPLIGFLVAETGSQAVYRVIADGKLSAADLKAAAARLSAPVPGAAALQAGLRYEYVSGANMLDEIAAHAEGAALPAWFHKNAARHRFFYQRNATQALFAERFRAYIEEAGKPCFDVRVPEHKPALHLGVNAVGRSLASVAPPAYEKLFTRRCEAEFQRTAIGAAAAVEAFRRERGRAPRDAAELVPAYLPAVPIDPFTGRPAQYVAATGRLRPAAR